LSRDFPSHFGVAFSGRTGHSGDRAVLVAGRRRADVAGAVASAELRGEPTAQTGADHCADRAAD
jgi:hypothetical protein